ncbi:MAG TPA: hypothetical protein VJ727_06225 [Rhodanobacteraceae bacterium]|nr:hypothetical protein [Rhodanobacteraceae bacterium]
MKSIIKKRTEREALESYPIRGEVTGWFFRLKETSAGGWLAEGIDLWGHKVSCQGTDERALMRQCEMMAEQINEQSLES